MKRILMTAGALCFASVIFAYNPPISGESLDRLVSPTQLTYASSSAGGGIFTAGPDAIVFNPALIASEQRITLDASYTAIFSSNGGANIFGSAFQTGILIPWKYFAVSGVVKGVFLPLDKIDVGNTLSTNIGIAKEVSERLSVGLGIAGGLYWGYGSDWSLSGNIGAMYRIPRVGFMKDFRIGVSVLNLGKNYTSTNLIGIDGKNTSDIFPMLGTTHVGAAALLFANDYIKGGASFELITPGFQNLIVAAGFHFAVNDALYLRIAEEINIREAVALADRGAYGNFMPAISLGYRLTFKTKNNEYMKRNGWGESDITVNAGWQQLYETVHAVSGNVKFNLGLADTDPPEIELWAGEDK